MELKLAIVETSTESGCSVQLLNEANVVDAVYTQPMIDYGIRGQPLEVNSRQSAH